MQTHLHRFPEQKSEDWMKSGLILLMSYRGAFGFLFLLLHESENHFHHLKKKNNNRVFVVSYLSVRAGTFSFFIQG